MEAILYIKKGVHSCQEGTDRYFLVVLNFIKAPWKRGDYILS